MAHRKQIKRIDNNFTSDHTAKKGRHCKEEEFFDAKEISAEKEIQVNDESLALKDRVRKLPHVNCKD